MKSYVIAEIGTCWGALDPEQRLASLCFHCEQAAAAGADAVKVQMFVPDEALFCPLPGDDERMENRWRNSFVSFEDWRRLKWYCEASLDIDFLASVFQPTAVEWIRELRPRYFKVASRAARTFPYGALPGPFLISTGMGVPPIVAHGPTFWLQCTSEYPVPLEKAKWNGYQGLSDHSGTIWPGLDAMARGAEFLEVHFAVGAFDGPDMAVSLTTDQLKLLTGARDAFARMHAG